MPKLTRKQIRERDEKVALRNRLLDMMKGANGGYSLPEPLEGDEAVCLSAELGLDVFGRWIGAVRREWGAENGMAQTGKIGNMFFAAEELCRFETLGEAVDRLYALGVRA